jgi:hypothetical protein
VSRLVLLAVIVLAAIAAADALRPEGKTEVGPALSGRNAAPVVLKQASSGFVAVGAFTRKRVLRNGREYLQADDVDAAFPGGTRGEPFDISHLATAADGTLALGVYKFPAKKPAEAAIELWRDGRLVSAFHVPPGSFGGGLGFADDGRLVATMLADGYTVLLFTRSGERRGSVPATSW